MDKKILKKLSLEKVELLNLTNEAQLNLKGGNDTTIETCNYFTAECTIGCSVADCITIDCTVADCPTADCTAPGDCR